MTAQLICKQCGKPVLGGYVNALGAVWHPEHFVCAACNLPFDSASFNVHDNKPYHRACYLEQIAPRCAACRKPLIGHYVQSGGKSYHDDCYRNVVVPRCVYCNEPLMGEYGVDNWGAKFCKKHRRNIPPASFAVASFHRRNRNGAAWSFIARAVLYADHALLKRLNRPGLLMPE